jgi:hypothetical protein
MSTFILFHAAYTKHVSTAMVSRSVSVASDVPLFTHMSAYRLADKSLKILEHLARRGSVWPEACGAAIKDLRTQLTRNPSNKLRDTGADRPDRSSTSPYDNTTSVASPHVIARTLSQTTIPVLGEPSPERIVGVGTDVRPSNHPDTRIAANLDHMSVLADTGLNVQTSGDNLSIPPLGDMSHNGLALDQSFQFSGNDNQDPFAGFDIPFWLGQDQYAGMINEWS